MSSVMSRWPKYGGSPPTNGPPPPVRSRLSEPTDEVVVHAQSPVDESKLPVVFQLTGIPRYVEPVATEYWNDKPCESTWLVNESGEALSGPRY